jgi:GntR family transcriptional regulator, transcriptional repressor for pyruvate dehydrogenase complex
MSSAPSAGVAAPSPGGMSQTDVVVQGIKDMLTSGMLGPGSRLPVEKDLATSLGVSRGSLREGVRALCIMGVLETRQGDGTYVTSLDSRLLLAPMGFMVDLQSPAHREDLHTVRRVLESEAAARAALYITDDQLAEAAHVLATIDPLVRRTEHLDHEAIMEADIAFHHLIAAGAQNAALAALIDAFASRTHRARLWVALNRQGQVGASHADHVNILAAVKARNPDRARLLMAHHLLVMEDYVHDQPGSDFDQ